GVDRFSADFESPRGWRQDAAEDGEERGLAGTAGSLEDDDFARLDGQGDAVEDIDALPSLLKRLGDDFGDEAVHVYFIHERRDWGRWRRPCGTRRPPRTGT